MNKTQMLSKEIDLNSINSWVEVVKYSPIDLERVYFYASEFDSKANPPIFLNTLEWAKRKLIEARGSLDMMIQTLIQVLHDRDFIKTSEDGVILMWLKDDLGRFMHFLDTSEKNNLIQYDTPLKSESKVGIARLSAYCKDMNTAYHSVYEVLLKSIKEYYSFKEDSEKKKVRDERTFVYILFSVFSLSLSFLGGITRNPDASIGKKGVVATLPSAFSNDWNLLSSDRGKEEIKKVYKEQTGHDLIDIPAEFLEEEQDGNSGGQHEQFN